MNDEHLLREFYEKHLEKWTKKPFSELGEDQFKLIREIPAYQVFASDRIALVTASKPTP